MVRGVADDIVYLMPKFERGFSLIIVLVAAGLLIGTSVIALLYFRPANPQVAKSTEDSAEALTQEGTPSSSIVSPLLLDSSSPDDDRLTKLESQIKTTKADQTLASRLSILEEQVKLINLKLQASPSPAAAATTVKLPVGYIPIGSISENVTATSWVGFGQLTFSIDPADYPGYKTMQLIGDLRLNSAGGTAHARLYNDSDQAAVSYTEISTTSTIFSSLSSSSFTLPSSKKTYRLQGKSDTGDQIYLQNVKIKVSF